MSSTDPELRIPDGAIYVTARQLAHRYQVSLKWIASRSEYLGATPISDAGNSPLRYHLPTADAYLESRRRQPLPPVRRARPGRPSPGATRTGAPRISFR